MSLVVSIEWFLIINGSINLTISKTNHISFTLKGILLSSDIDNSVQYNFKDSNVIYVTCVYDIVYQILKPYIILFFTVLTLDEKIIVDLIYCNS